MWTDDLPESKPATIALIDSVTLQLDLLRPILDAKSVSYQVFNSVAQARSSIASGSIDLLILTADNCGATEIHQIRRFSKDYVPVIVICQNIDDQVLDRFQGAEVDSYIVKPINPRFLITKINSSLVVRRLHQLELEQHRQLRDYSRLIEQEQEVAASIFNNVLQSQFLETEVVKAMMSPMALFNGDLLLVSKTPDNRLHLLLGDFTGHGLSASVAATPTADIFYGMTQKGFGIAEIVREINGKLQVMLPANMFLAATAIALCPDSRTLSLITCGLPEHYLVNYDDNSWKVIESRNIPLGIQKTVEFEEQSFQVSQHHHLYLLTDGVFEAENESGEQFGDGRIRQAVSSDPELGVEILYQRLSGFTRGLQQKDDITMVKLICDVDTVPWMAGGRVRQAAREFVATHWKNIMVFDIHTLKKLNPVPLMVNTLMEIQGLQQHRQAIFLVIGELFANALDHGLLGLDSSIKNSAEGFIAFYQLKEQRLQELQEGTIRFSFTHQPIEQGGRLTIKVVDSGNGFDWRRRMSDLQDNHGFCGRGIRLIQSMCRDLHFHAGGNRLTAVFEWRKD